MTDSLRIKRIQLNAVRLTDALTQVTLDNTALRSRIEGLRAEVQQARLRGARLDVGQRHQSMEATRAGGDAAAGPLSAGRKRGKAAVVSWDMGHNPVGRAYVLYQLLERDWDTTLLGPSWERYGKGLWQPLANLGIKARTYPCKSIVDFFPWAAVEATRERFDLVYVCKPRLPSLLLGLLIKEHSGCPLILDIDDFELSFFKNKTVADMAELRAAGSDALIEPYEETATRFGESLIPHADAVTVSNVVLRRRYGGFIVRHARDEAKFSMAAFDRDAVRRELGIAPEEFALVFVGTPRPHKGIYEVARALHELADPLISFHIVGTIADKRVERELQKYDRAKLVLHPNCPFEDLPRILSAADCVPLIQDRDHPISASQMPSKISDATALGRPVLMTEVPPVSDLGELGGITFVTNEGLAEAIRDLKAKRDRGETPAAGVREFFLSELSLSVNRTRLDLAAGAALSTNRALPPVFHELKDLVRTCCEQATREALADVLPVPAYSPGDGAGDPLDVALFWKQNDTGIYGRRPDMIAKHMLKSGRVRRVIVFDAPVEVGRLRQRSNFEAAGEIDQSQLVLRNTMARWTRALDTERLLQRVFIYGQTGAETLLGEALPREADYPDFVEEELRANGFEPARTMAWVCPVAWDFPAIARRLGFASVVADVIDDQRAWGNSPHYIEQLDRSYRETLGLADVVFTNCDPVAEAFAGYAHAIHVVPNGAERFDLVGDLPPWTLLKHLPRPIIGYVGNLRDRIDWALLAEVVAMRPSWSFVFAGSAHDSPSAQDMIRFANVTFLGVVEYPKLLPLLRSLDVGIVPHVYSRLTERMNPLKVYNYFAAGLPIVATEVPNTEEMKPYIRVGEDAAGFVAAIEAALQQPYREDRERQRLLETISWDARVAKIFSVIDAALAARSTDEVRERS